MPAMTRPNRTRQGLLVENALGRQAWRDAVAQMRLRGGSEIGMLLSVAACRDHDPMSHCELRLPRHADAPDTMDGFAEAVEISISMP
ncbi:hypothetical protein Ga0074812_13129 [Parafrankia irregularis]|uniref:Uncharacterized protein n=1 Tax=Parafrankia irregularis TaxID=795642 RepID=A0A0S4QW48_9ACTN|nr:hypothetical protein Ga0074812_13129 [Parafrankia irregularis]